MDKNIDNKDTNTNADNSSNSNINNNNGNNDNNKPKSNATVNNTPDINNTDVKEEKFNYNKSINLLEKFKQIKKIYKIINYLIYNYNIEDNKLKNEIQSLKDKVEIYLFNYDLLEDKEKTNAANFIFNNFKKLSKKIKSSNNIS